MVKARRKRRMLPANGKDDGGQEGIKIVDTSDEPKQRRKPRVDKGEVFGNLLCAAVGGLITPADTWLGNFPAGLRPEESDAIVFSGRMYYENAPEQVDEKLGALAGIMLSVTLGAIFLPRIIQAWRRLKKPVIPADTIPAETAG